MTTQPPSRRALPRFAWIWKDTRSAFVGAVVASLVSLIAAAFSQPTEVFIADMNDIGQSRPLSLLTRLADAEDAARTYTVSPASLNKTIFCEYIRLESGSQTGNLEQLLNRFPRCFRVREMSENAFEISANIHSPDMVQDGSVWQCGCG